MGGVNPDPAPNTWADPPTATPYPLTQGGGIGTPPNTEGLPIRGGGLNHRPSGRGGGTEGHTAGAQRASEAEAAPAAELLRQAPIQPVGGEVQAGAVLQRVVLHLLGQRRDGIPCWGGEMEGSGSGNQKQHH